MNTPRGLILWLAIIACVVPAWSQQDRRGFDRAKLASIPKVAKPIAPAQQKIAPQLLAVLAEARKPNRPAKLSALSNRLVRLNDHGEVQVYVGIKDWAALPPDVLPSSGLRIELVNEQHHTIQGWLPIASLEKVAGLPWVHDIRPPSYRQIRSGSCMTEGDAILGANLVREAGITGRGIKIGVISDGTQNKTISQATGDLPRTIQSDPRYPGTGDAGTALLEIVYDVAPGADLAFSGPLTSLEFIEALDFLVNTAQCDVVFDDLGFFAEPYFEDGPIAQAVANVVSKVAYVSACGNDGQRHYQAQYLDVEPFLSGWPLDCHDFGSGDADLAIRIPPGGHIAVFLQWSDQFGASGNDYDLFLYNDALTTALVWSNAIQNGDDNPYEAFTFHNTTGNNIDASILIARTSGEPRVLEMFIWDVSWQEHVISLDSIFGHPAVAGVLSVGAIGANDNNYDSIEAFSSLGPSTITFPSPVVRNTPRCVAIDGVSVTGVGGHPTPYYGTSAASAHAAAIAGLILSRAPGLTPGSVRSLMEGSAVDLGAPGFDIVFGYGRLNAYQALPQVTGSNNWHLFR